MHPDIIDILAPAPEPLASADLLEHPDESVHILAQDGECHLIAVHVGLKGSPATLIYIDGPAGREAPILVVGRHVVEAGEAADLWLGDTTAGDHATHEVACLALTAAGRAVAYAPRRS